MTASVQKRTCEFQTQIVTPSEFPKIQEIALEWAKIAETKARSENNTECKDRLEDCKTTSILLEETLEEERRLSDNIVMICTLFGTIQAISISKMVSKDLHLRYIVTHPANIGSGGIRGSGSALLQENEKLAKKLNANRVKVVSFLSAEEFYFKHGYLRSEINTLYKPMQCFPQEFSFSSLQYDTPQQENQTLSR
jgi:N-acetylglutamate synthase-like GNAT family acetyltransferase